MSKKVLIAFECSGIVRRAFRAVGCSAYSNDLQPADDGSEFHILGDAIGAIKSQEWDLIIAHPPCTALAVSGNSTYAEGMPKYSERLSAIDYTMDLFQLCCSVAPKVCMENPVGVLPVKPSQYVQPWQFGHAESKKTGFWLFGLPLLMETKNVKSEYDQLPKNKAQRLHYLSPSKDRAKLRSETYTGIAQAMAEQWSSLI
tara:strand:- start:672 stop:1271 length:600 start_codon:yes stop_codon:yes gene_type:complete